jgi:drug/metabolite transporter (DMT)-like permease
MKSSAAVGATLAVTTAVTWGGQFVVGKSALGRVDAFPLTTIRYAAAALLLLGLLAAVEGRRSLRVDGHGARLFWLGSLGFAGFNLLAYTGLAHARPQSASLLTALGPLLTALVLWRRNRVRPAASTFALLAVALAGVALVISGGDPASIVHGSIGWGDGLVLAGVFSFVLYGLGAAALPGFSPLRYTALTAGLGWLTIAAATAVATGAGLVPLPSAGDHAADCVSHRSGRGRRSADVERRDRAARAPERRPVREPDSRDDVRDRDCPRLPAGDGRAGGRGADDRRPRREQPARPQTTAAVRAGAGLRRVAALSASPAGTRPSPDTTPRRRALLRS